MSDMVKITRSKLESLSSAIRTKLGTDATKLTLPEMIVDIPELAPKPVIQPGFYTNKQKYPSGGFAAKFIVNYDNFMRLVDNGSLEFRKSWEDCIKDGDLIVNNGKLKAKTTSTTYGERIFKSEYTVIIIDDSVTAIDDKAFYYYERISGVKIPEGVTSIGQYAFGSTSMPSQLYIPPSVTHIASSAFKSCTTISRIFYEGPMKDTWNSWKPSNATLGTYTSMNS